MESKVVSAGGGNSLELMIGQTATEMFSGSSQGVVEHVIWVIHLVDFEDCLQTTLVEGAVVRH